MQQVKKCKLINSHYIKPSLIIYHRRLSVKHEMHILLFQYINHAYVILFMHVSKL